MPYLAYGALALLFLSGFYLEFSESWNALYKANVIFHSIFAIPVTIWLLGYFMLHAVAKTRMAPGGAENKSRFRLFIVASAAGAGLAALAPPIFLPLALLLAGVAFHFSTKKILFSQLRSFYKANAIAWQTVFFLLLACLLTGVPLLPIWGTARPPAYFAIHRCISYGTVALFGVCLVFPVITRFRQGRVAIGKYLRGTVPALAASALCTAAFALILIAEGRVEHPVFSTSLTRMPIEERPEELKPPPPLPKETADMLMSSRSCSENTGCHKVELEDFEISNHRTSNRTPYFQRNMAQLVEEIGKHNQVICSTCHFPYMAMSGNLDIDDSTNAKGFSCAYCHVISAVDPNFDDPSLSFLTLEANMNHMRMVARPDENPRIGKLDELLIKMNPAGHARVFKRPLYFEDNYCLACHAGQIEPKKTAGLEGERCIDCHMQARSFLGYKGEKRNHMFLGANTTVPYAMGIPKAQKLISGWVTGYLTANVSTVNFWQLRKDSATKNREAKWLALNFVPNALPRKGETFEFEVISTNVGVGHQFPAGPIDLLDAWLEIQATDANGNVFYHLGTLGENHRLSADFPAELKLGGYILDAEGNRIDRHRIWRKKKKVTERVMRPGVTMKNQIAFAIPDDAKGPIAVTAKWNYRKHNQDFFEWGMQDAAIPGGGSITAPVSVVGSVEQKFELKN